MAKEIESPCISECKLKAEVCTGCGRTRDEIKHWKGMKRREKMEVVGLASRRLKLIKKNK
ncbi:DUF1289 domain-containing protein [Herbaspirillum sp. alder98]|uniref:DUF1289 domain-containing protein n=1 Tax=Herbaspirillum sp. alder98 TaxID=2913096 RepID=UPI001CD82702|nr:DUF1289 domain-containing protein [Herbaspirillum sp. alder98]MCA1323786.1 DUF1289 domain-containing protein [Herbaspirillum sp. alder98]